MNCTTSGNLSYALDPDATDIRRPRRLRARVPGLTAWITMVCPNTTGLAEPTFVLELDRRVHGVALETPDRSLPVLQKMTAAERAVAMVVADGFSNQEIADRLGKTVRCGEVSTASHLSEDRPSGPGGSRGRPAFAPGHVGEARLRDPTGATGSTVRLEPDATPYQTSELFLVESVPYKGRRTTQKTPRTQR